MESVFNFLTDLKVNNNREWFAINKSVYDNCYEEMIVLTNHLLAEMNTHDIIETVSGKKSLHRIYRDVRFSKDKSPYKSNWSGSLKRATTDRRGGYYYHLAPGGSFLAGGFWGPNKEDLKLIRSHLSQDADEYRDIINSHSFKKTFQKVEGEQLKKSPKGFDIDHPNIDLIKHKQFILKYDLTNDEVLSPDFAKTVSNIYKQMRPYFDIMTEFLTTDLDGVKTI
jgi:uncharacterized protein (TIGR02453 family)